MNDDNDSREMTDEEEANAVTMHAEIMRQLLESQRFVRFFQVNYDLHKFINEEEKTIEFRLIEVPPSLAEERLTKLVTEHAKEHHKDVVLADATDLKKYLQ